MAENKNYYDILGISKNASADEIKSNYRQLAKRYHPDVCKDPDGEAKFKEIQEAYSVLSDPEKKQRYDQFGTADPQAGGFNPFAGFNPFSGFGFGRRGEQKERGDDLKINISLTMEELYEGVHKKLRVRKKCTCDRCNGSGSSTNETTTCPHCNGTGMETRVTKTAFGIQQVMTPCTHCHGTGHIIKDPCPKCNGTGLIDDNKEIEFDVPAGMPGDAYFTVRGKGNDGPHRGVPGDLHVVVTELPNQKGLSRDDNNNLIYNLNAKITDLIYGSDVEIPWIKGYKKLHLEPGTQPGKVITRYGEGFPDPNYPSNKSDYKIKINCSIPKATDLSKTDKEYFDKIKKNGNC